MHIEHGDIAALIENKVYAETEDTWKLVDFELTTRTSSTPTIKLSLLKGEEKVECELTDDLEVFGVA